MKLSILLAFPAATCNTTPPAPPAPTPAPTVQSPDGCQASCDKAQTACANPAPVTHCVSQCTASATNLTGETLDCFALTATCNVTCEKQP